MFRRSVPLALSFALVTARLAVAAPTAQAQAAFDRGEKALAANSLDQAERAYQDALKAAPGFTSAINGFRSG
jgi:hypothetical protein